MIRIDIYISGLLLLLTITKIDSTKRLILPRNMLRGDTHMTSTLMMGGCVGGRGGGGVRQK